MVSCSGAFVLELSESTLLIGTVLTKTILPRTVFARMVIALSDEFAIVTDYLTAAA